VRNVWIGGYIVAYSPCLLTRKRF